MYGTKINCILGIETSCDETGVAVFHATRGIIAEQLYSQAEHAQFGGVVPELAARDHVRKLAPMVRHTLQAGDIDAAQIDAIAYTAGPGLAGALLVGASMAEAYALSLDRPAIAVHHMEGHLLSPLLEVHAPAFPFLALLVSGGHTMLVEVESVGRYRLLGETLDDAAGEAFDKTARLLGLPYPGGPELARLAESGDPQRFDFPRPMTGRPGLDFSFSGLKTHTRLLIEQHPDDRQAHADIAAGFQQSVVDTLVIKCTRALDQARLQRLVIAGGVSANRLLRERLQKRLGDQVYYPRPELCTDNGAMIAHAGWHRRGQASTAHRIRIKPRWPLEELTSDH